MIRNSIFLIGLLISIVFVVSCQPEKKAVEKKASDTVIQRKLANYAEVKLSADLTSLSADQIKLFSHLIKAADAIDELYWLQAYGNKNALLESITDPDMKQYAKINYGPWDRLDGFKPFTEDFPPRPLGIGFFPADINQEEFFQLNNDDKYSPFTKIERDASGKLQVIPFSKAYQSQLQIAANHLKQAAAMAEKEDFKAYLEQRAADLVSDNFVESDKLWLNLTDNELDFIAGPIVNTEDNLIWTKYSYGAFILLRDNDCTKNVSKYAALMPFLQQNLPLTEKYKAETSSSEANLSIYNVLYNSGHCNAGNKLIGLNLPVGNNGSDVKRVYFKNVMQAKFDKILNPISELVIDEKQRKNVNFESFFLNTIFFELTGGIDMTSTINGNGDVKDALKEHHNVINELKNDVLRMYLLNQVHDMRQIEGIEMLDNYVTYMADVFRSIRFGVTDAQGVANMIRFYYFEEQEAFKYNPKTGTYKINDYKMKKATESLAKMVLEIQATGDYAAADKLIKDKGYIRNELLQDLYRIQRAKIPKDLIYDQGEKVIIAEK
ncbi:Zn-dependent hydrolase [Marinifilum caeruleilacunae]|uniref:Zn-dependent hydrolase n=1 Tax=Marinifilum caeruleilacunae TaxID=2499076 RepID=A0ABX1X022_9BACT|nr:Zn-dependent hydrolase [Marinifilum caeruleilacunae]NOU61736.1 Zn-dependent hydrolase [Marinifilum caeruleilacunae]